MAVTVRLPPRLTNVPLIVILLLDNLSLLMLPANMAFVTDPVSPVVTIVPSWSGTVSVLTVAADMLSA